MIHKKVNILAIVVILLILLFSIYRGFIYSSFLRKQIKVVGLLSVVTSCVIPEGCGPKYKLFDKIIFVNHFLEKGDIEVIKSEDK